MKYVSPILMQLFRQFRTVAKFSFVLFKISLDLFHHNACSKIILRKIVQ